MIGRARRPVVYPRPLFGFVDDWPTWLAWSVIVLALVALAVFLTWAQTWR
ncbi:MAG TPA: hypothetical protein VHX38_23920 [Pseudonocardiaceae bacterium]|nr:hypothetical protein [Pseudonocardiaceae bacterium]